MNKTSRCIIALTMAFVLLAAAACGKEPVDEHAGQVLMSGPRSVVKMLQISVTVDLHVICGPCSFEYQLSAFLHIANAHRGIPLVLISPLSKSGPGYFTRSVKRPGLCIAVFYSA